MRFTLLATAAAALMMSASPVMAKDNLLDYEAVLSAMKAGKTVFALVDYSKCQVKEKSDNAYGMEVRTVGIRMDHLFELTETRFDGKRMNVVGFAQHNWGGAKSGYMLSRLLIHVWQDNSIDILDDNVDPLTFKVKDREWLLCKVTKDGSGGVTFTS